MNPLQIMQMLQNSNNPMAMLQGLSSQNPMLNRALEMGQGKNVVQIQNTIRNIAKQRGMSEQDLAMFLAQYGLKL